jgi:hypothetical protein
MNAPVPAAVVVYNQPPSPEGGIIQSSLRDPEGSNTDSWAWDGFSFPWDQTVTEIRWRGGYDLARRGSGLPVADFTVSIYASIASGSEPIIASPLVRYELRSNASETPAEVLGGVQTYDYSYVLPVPFQARARTKYWVQIEGYQPGAPDWGLVSASGGDGQYFRRLAGAGYSYQLVAGDTAFTLLGPSAGGYKLYVSLVHIGNR